jgi:acyl-CoA synthetase (NDP forming)
MPSAGARSSTQAVPRGQTLSELDSAVLLEAAGLPVVPRRRVSSPEQAAEAAREFGGTVAVKILSADITHKTDIGGVVLGAGPGEAAGAYAQVLGAACSYAPNAGIDGALVSPMVTGGLETIIGVSNDPVFGPVVMFGLGGVFVESIRDVTCRLAPFSEAEAMTMIREIRGYALLEGSRGGTRCDVPALARALSAVSVFADEHRGDVLSIDLNPFLVLAEGNGAVAVDAVVVGRP